MMTCGASTRSGTQVSEVMMLVGHHSLYACSTTMSGSILYNKHMYSHTLMHEITEELEGHDKYQTTLLGGR